MASRRVPSVLAMGMVLAALALWGVPPAGAPRWEAPSACPEQAVVEQWIDRLMLHGPAEVPDWQGRVTQTQGRGFSLTLTVSGRARSLEDADCETLAVAAALVVAVAADPVAVVDAIHSPIVEAAPVPPRIDDESPRPIVAPTSIDAPRAEPLATPLDDAAPEVMGVVSAAIGAELAVLPRPGFAATLGGGVLWSALRVEALGVVSLPRDIQAREPTFGARAAVAAGQVRGCWVVRAPPVDVPLCLAGEVGAVWARGFGPTIEPQARAQPWAAAIPSLGVTGWLSGRFGLEARVSTPIGLYKPAVHLAGVDVPVFRAGAVGARLWVGPVLRFP